MTTLIRLLLALAILTFVNGCSKKQSPEIADATPLNDGEEPLVPAGELAESRVGYQFAIYYLPTPPSDPVAALDALLKTDFPDIQRVETPPQELKSIFVSAKVVTDITTYAPPAPDMLAHFGRGLNKEQAESLQGSQQVLVLNFYHPQEGIWDRMRTACKLVSQLAQTTSGILWDEETREVFTPEAWNERRLKGWESGVPEIARHTTIHAYNKDDYVRAITLGMSKFGLPDIVVENFSWSANTRIGHVINLFSQAMAEGAKIEKEGQYDLDLKTLQNAEARDPQVESLMNHATAKAELTLRFGVKEDGDPDNRLIALSFDRYPGKDMHAKQDAMISKLFGWQDAIKKVHHGQALEAASKRAREKLPALRTSFRTGLEPGEYILLKAPFDVPTGGHEYMWVEVTSWEGESIKGLLKNEPFQIPTLHGGQSVAIEQRLVFDYIRHFANGTQEGNATGKILEQMQGAEEKR